MSAPSAKPLFRAISGPALPAQPVGLAGLDAPPAAAPRSADGDTARRALDFYPTAQPEAIRALFARDGARIAECGAVWEPAVGDGALAREIVAMGLPCVGSDVVDRGWPGVEVRSYYEYAAAPARAIVTNPPFCEINARDGRGRWLRHTLNMPGWEYCALLLSWDWPAAVANGLGAMLDAEPFSWCYLLRWKLDFTGAGSPPQRNAWFVWDRRDPRGTDGLLPAPDFRWMNRSDARQGDLFEAVPQ
ncbi:MAG: hypothetical protein MUE98_00270 [Rhodobacteraceae bacterium]|jgi:hypothetical protein|nr:hypothetical protein [Paracoccaceae bacterium]